MAGSVTLHVETRYAEEQMRRMIAVSKFGARKVVERSFKGFIGRLVAITPPGMVQDMIPPKVDEDGNNVSKNYGTPKKRGTRNVKKDILNVFRPVGSERQIRRLKPIQTASEVERYHDGARNNRGRTRNRVRNKKVPVVKSVLVAYIKKKQEHVGRLAAGWQSAASRFGTRTPTWVQRHKSPGSIMFLANERGIQMKATNSIKHASEHNNFNRGLYIAINMQANAMGRQIDSYLQKQMAKQTKGELA